VIVAPTLAWQYRPGQFLGVAPLLAYQQFKAYGLQAFQGVSQAPEHVTNQGYDSAFGAGLRLGWLARLQPWLTLGATYATRIYMQDFEEYRGLLADGGNFNIPANYSVGIGLQPTPRWTLGLDVQRIEFGGVRALANPVTNSLVDPASKPLGSRNGSGFNWRDQTNYRAAVAYQATTHLTLRAGYAYGKLAQKDKSIDSVSFNMFAPNPRANATVGGSYALGARDEINLAYGRYLQAGYQGPSASAGLGIGGTERIRPFVSTVMIGWTRRF
jgi:long-chain fatty acid transport protein